jgi:hypothetical protein
MIALKIIPSSLIQTPPGRFAQSENFAMWLPNATNVMLRDGTTTRYLPIEPSARRLSSGKPSTRTVPEVATLHADSLMSAELFVVTVASNEY